MRCRLSILLAVSACRPEPIPDYAEPPPREDVAAVGDQIVIAERGEGIEASVEVDGAGYIDVPLCGTTEVAGLAPEAVCTRVADCLATALRSPTVAVKLHSASVSCHVDGHPPPDTDPLLDALAEHLSDPADGELVRELIDLVVDRHVRLLVQTEAHPVLVDQADHARRLLKTAPRGTSPHDARLHIAVRLAQAERRAALKLEAGYGRKHPKLLALARRIAALKRLGPAAEVPPALAYVLALEHHLLTGEGEPPPAPPDCTALKAALEPRITYWRGRRDGAYDPTAPQAVLDGLLQARSAC